MRVLLVGSGGREHALAWRIAQSPRLGALFATHAHPNWPIGTTVIEGSQLSDWVHTAQNIGADLVVIGPEAPLAAGIVDRLAEVSIPCFGPTQAAARLEASKAFAKQIMTAAGVPNAASVVGSPEDTAVLARAKQGQVVVKADGLAAGKGVFICPTAELALQALDEVRAFGASATTVVLEDLLVGPEVSLFALCDGERATALLAAQDHKRLLDGDLGPNTGGMGAYVPCPWVDDAMAEELLDRIHRPVLAEMAKRGTPFRGLLYAGLMLTDAGPRVLEFNARFGDPETQPLMCLWKDDILPWLYGSAIGQLPPGKPLFHPGFSCCVVIAAPGYPMAPRPGDMIPEGEDPKGGKVFFAGASRIGEQLQVTGGRVLGVTAIGESLLDACKNAYAVVPKWLFNEAQFRNDIGHQGLAWFHSR